MCFLRHRICRPRFYGVKWKYRSAKTEKNHMIEGSAVLWMLQNSYQHLEKQYVRPRIAIKNKRMRSRRGSNGGQVKPTAEGRWLSRRAAPKPPEDCPPQKSLSISFGSGYLCEQALASKLFQASLNLRVHGIGNAISKGACHPFPKMLCRKM